MGRLVLLVTSPRVPPGLLSADAWDVVRAGPVLHAGTAHPQVAALEAAGVSPLVVEPSGSALVETASSAEGDSPVVWLGSTDGDPGLVDAVAAEVARRAERGEPVPEVEVLTGSYDPPGARLLDLVAVMDRLRSPGGCPWDSEQTHRSLATYLLEEAYETLEAIEVGDDEHLREELGDLLLQVVFHARIAEERPDAPWDVDDVAAGIVDKLVRRHPHVFGDVHAPSAAHVEANWEVLKASEKGRESVLDGVPSALPALSLAAKLLSRASRSGLSVPLPSGADVGSRLLHIVSEAREAGVDPEQALRDAVREWAAAFRAAERSDRRP
ncbi:MAG TPA: MazG family protein [Jiangellales bacterium]|nr:MazG family protein [Jiangellales bacterium]